MVIRSAEDTRLDTPLPTEPAKNVHTTSPVHAELRYGPQADSTLKLWVRIRP